MKNVQSGKGIEAYVPPAVETFEMRLEEGIAKSLGGNTPYPGGPIDEGWYVLDPEI